MGANNKKMLRIKIEKEFSIFVAVYCSNKEI